MNFSKSMPVSVARWNIWLAYRLARQGLLPQFCRLLPRNWTTYYCASKNNCSLLCRCAICSGVVSKNNAQRLHIVQHVKKQRPTWIVLQCEPFLLQRRCTQPELSCHQYDEEGAGRAGWIRLLLLTYVMKVINSDGKDNNSDRKWLLNEGCLLTGHPSMRAKATRFTPESITAKENFTYESVDQILLSDKCALFVFHCPLVCWN